MRIRRVTRTVRLSHMEVAEERFCHMWQTARMSMICPALRVTSSSRMLLCSSCHQQDSSTNKRHTADTHELPP
eukprot:2490423-Amphidinium_carterae.1